MSIKIFVSYCHAQGEWVRDHLIPVLKAGGTDVLFDERFVAGKGVVGQMDKLQDQAERNLLVLSPDYLLSPMCKHEMNRAVALDPDFSKGRVIPVRRVKVEMPPKIRCPNPIYVSLDSAHETDPVGWNKILTACNANSKWSVPAWLDARNDTRRYLGRRQSVSLVVTSNSPWRVLLEDLRRPGGSLEDLAQVDLDSPASHTRRGLVNQIFRSMGTSSRATEESSALGDFQRYLEGNAAPPTVALLHFERARRFDGDFFGALRYLIDKRLLVVLFQSRQPFTDIVPSSDPLSRIDLKTVTLGA